ncbi:MAG: DUF507 family protein [Helicobacter trogontum]|uniref:DUF507 family protein n=1 Tax=Helicobacter trogontum TaxID=50960 RepID=UPI0024305942|nr:DUF507 family protein [Helicobacter trogontum]MCI5787081.1 DUF507 family protein [Helicobacter trogontum]
MKLKPQHAQFLAERIILELSRSNLVQINATLPNLNRLATTLIKEDMQQEYAIESKARELLDAHQDTIEEDEINEKQVFAMIKKQIAKERGFLLSYKERYSQLAHEILDALFEESYIDFNVPENVVKNFIIESIDSYFDFHEHAYDNAIEKIKNYKRKLIPGSEEYELIFAKLYEEELNKRG